MRVNERIEELFGIEKEQHEAAGKSPDSIQLISDDVPWSPGEERLAEYVARTGEPVRNEECVVEIPSGERLVLLVDAVPLFEEGELKRVVETYEDVTDRVERERQLEQQNAELDRLNRINHTIRDLNTALVGANSREEIEQAVCDQLSASGRYDHTLVVRASGDELAVQATDGADLPVGELPPEALTRHAVETGDICQPKDIGDGDPAWTVCGAVGADSGTMAAIPLTYDGQTHGALAVCADAPDVLEEGELELLGELGGTVGHAIAAVESREREATLTALYEATQDLLAVGDPQEVCEVVVETAESVLDPLAVGIFLFDDEANVLELAEGTEQMREFFGDSTAFGPGLQDSITWQTYIEGEEKFVPDVHESDNLAHPETDARSSLFLPLGEHGVFVVGTDEPMSLGEQKRNLVGLFAAATEAALDRVVGQAGLRERDRRLEERTTRLQHLKGLFSLVADIDTALREAGTPDELHRSVCEELVDTDPYEFAWVGTISPDGTAVEPRTWADGETRGQAYLDEVAFGLEGDNPAARAARTGDPVCVSNATAHLRAEDWAQTAVEHGYESVLAVPLTHEDATYGVLTVYASETHAFDERARSVFDRLGTLVPEISTGLQRDQTVLADRVVELELSLPDLETFPNAVAATVDHPVRYRHVTPTSDGRTRLVFSLADPPAGALRDIEERFVTVDSLDVVERAGETTLQATLSGSTVATTLLDCGALPHEIVARPDDTAVTVRMPHDADVRLFLDRMAEHYPGVELVSRRDATVHDETEAAAQRALAEDLTDRQREVLRTAYEHGFFESPRATTGVELADILGVSQPTVTHHLREAQRRLFEALFTNG
ncbi:MAG: PAS domain S-box-containing protein [Halovenus sp.]